MLDDKTYRTLMDDTFARIDRAFDAADPDMAEVQLGQGTLSVTFRGRVKLILSPQPPVKQLWAACRDRAWHFDWEEAGRRWLDDRGQGVELFGLVAELAKAEGGVTVQVAS